MEQESIQPAPSAAAAMSLPVGTRLGEFELLSVIGEGGFSIVYLAQDHSLQRTVAIKEYLPGAIAFRDAEGEVRPRFEKYDGTFRTGLQSFLNEARILAQFEHPALIRIHRFWEQNGTAYMVMQFCKGRTLRKLLQEEPQRKSDEIWLKNQMIAPVLDALRILHAKRYYHRDLSPDNIMILDTGAPMLLDFGAARQVIGDMTQALTVILKPGFAPIEQYADDESMRQGPWTDIYGVGAVLYFAVTGKAPVASVARLVKDPLKKLQLTAEYGVSLTFAQAIDHSLAVFPNDRPQSVDEFQQKLLHTSVEDVALETFEAKVSAAAIGPMAADNVQVLPEISEKIAPLDTVPEGSSSLTPTSVPMPNPAENVVGHIQSDVTDSQAVGSLGAPPVEQSFNHNAAEKFKPSVTPGIRSGKPWMMIGTGVAAVLTLGVAVAWFTTKNETVSDPVVLEQSTVGTGVPQATANSPRVASGGGAQPKVEPPAEPIQITSPVVSRAPEAPVLSVVPREPSIAQPISGTPAGNETAAPLPTTVTMPSSVAKVQGETKSAAPELSKPIDPTPPLVVKPIDDPTKLPKTSESGKTKDAISDLLNGTRGAGEKSPATSTAVAPVSTERGVAEVRPSKPGAYLRLSVQPWGRVIVDGQDKGISPPVTRIWLPEGEHRIVLENDNQQRHSDTVRIVDKKDLALSHKF